MKLYASIESERATVRQGGNDFLEIAISADRLGIAEVSIHEENGEWHVKIWERFSGRHSFTIPTEETIQKSMWEEARRIDGKQ